MNVNGEHLGTRQDSSDQKWGPMRGILDLTSAKTWLSGVPCCILSLQSEVSAIGFCLLQNTPAQTKGRRMANSMSGCPVRNTPFEHEAECKSWFESTNTDSKDPQA